MLDLDLVLGYSETQSEMIWQSLVYCRKQVRLPGTMDRQRTTDQLNQKGPTYILSYTELDSTIKQNGFYFFLFILDSSC